MKAFLALALAALLAACGATAGPDAAICPVGQHECPCATGSYCLGMGQMCLAPTAACPGG
jgi:hypothetical protein